MVMSEEFVMTVLKNHRMSGELSITESVFKSTSSSSRGTMYVAEFKT